MSSKDDEDYIYDKIHTVEVKDSSNRTSNKSITITVKKQQGNNLVIKLRDLQSFFFNYTSNINVKKFLQMKNEQALDIDFDEFETHLLEMLSLNSTRKMLLKCEIMENNNKCRLIFYEKSKIKSLIFLSVEMAITNQLEILKEMEQDMVSLKEANNGLVNQLDNAHYLLKEKDKAIKNYKETLLEIEKKCCKEFQIVSKTFDSTLKRFESMIYDRIMKISSKLMKATTGIVLVKNEHVLKSASNARLHKIIETLKTENFHIKSSMSKLQSDFTNSERSRRDCEAEISRLNLLKKEKDQAINQLQEELNQCKADLQESTSSLAKKSELFDEVKKDMEQANRVIRNYNLHYDAKAKEVEELQEHLKAKDEMIKKQIFENNRLFKEFSDYQLEHNRDKTDKLLSELHETKEKIEGLEKEKRELAKLNGLLTRKLQQICPQN